MTKDGDKCKNKDCDGHYYWRGYCGAYVCDKCEDHADLARCFCGWGIHESGDPEQILEMWG